MSERRTSLGRTEETVGGGGQGLFGQEVLAYLVYEEGESLDDVSDGAVLLDVVVQFLGLLE